MAEINIYLKDKKKLNTSIFFTVHNQGKRYRIAPGIKVEVAKWKDDKKKCVTGRVYPDGIYINEKIEEWISFLKTVLKSFTGVVIPTEKEFKQRIQDLRNPKEKPVQLYFLDYMNNAIEESNKPYGTRKTYRMAYKKLKEFEDSLKEHFTFDEIDIHFYDAFRKSMEQKGYSQNYFGSIIKVLKTFMNSAKDEGLHSSDKYNSRKFVKTEETADTIYLTDEELRRINDLEISPELISHLVSTKHDKKRELAVESKIRALNNCRNRFLIGAYTGLRVSDFSRIDISNVEKNFIRIKPTKGANKNADVVIPMHPIVRDIFGYGFELEKSLSDQTINKNIKIVCELAGIDDSVTISRTVGGKLKEYTKKKFELVTTHTARRSAATNMYKAGIPSLAIMKITGHRTEKSFLKYIKVTNEENAVMLANHPFFNL